MARERNLTHHPFDTQKLPLPSADSEPTYAAWRNWLEIIRPLVEAQHHSTLNQSQLKMLSLGMAGVVDGLVPPDLEIAVPYEIYREKLDLARALAWQKERKVGANGPTFSPLSPDPHPLKWKPPLFEVWKPQRANEKPVPDQQSVKEALRQHYLALLLPELEKRAPVWWKVLDVLHKRSPEDLSVFEVSTWRLAKEAGVSKASVRLAVVVLEEKKLVEAKHGLWNEDPTKTVRPKYRLLGITGQ